MDDVNIYSDKLGQCTLSNVDHLIHQSLGTSYEWSWLQL